MEENINEQTDKYEVVLFTTGNLDVLNNKIQRFLEKLLSTRFEGMINRQYESRGWGIEVVKGCRIFGKKCLNNKLHLLMTIPKSESIKHVVSQIICAICIGIRGKYSDYINKRYKEYPCIWSQEFGCSALEDEEFEKRLKEWGQGSDIA